MVLSQAITAPLPSVSCSLAAVHCRRWHGSPGIPGSTSAADLLAAIIAEPDCDDLRLVYADFCEEEGDEARAEFIRVQCELARLPEPEPCETEEGETQCGNLDCAYRRRETLRRREQELLPAIEVPWAVLCPTTGGNTSIGDPPWTFRRGFVEAITLSAESWLTHAGDLCAAIPLCEVTLTSMWPGGVLWYDSDHVKLAGLPAMLERRRRDERPPYTETMLDLLAAQWPRITFHLPE